MVVASRYSFCNKYTMHGDLHYSYTISLSSTLISISLWIPFTCYFVVGISWLILLWITVLSLLLISRTHVTMIRGVVPLSRLDHIKGMLLWRMLVVRCVPFWAHSCSSFPKTGSAISLSCMAGSDSRCAYGLSMGHASLFSRVIWINRRELFFCRSRIISSRK